MDNNTHFGYTSSDVTTHESLKPTDDRLFGDIQESSDEPHKPGELSHVTGIIAVEGAMQVTEATATLRTKEQLAEQLASAAAGYTAVLEVVNAGRRKRNVLAPASDETLAAELEAWFTEDKLAYVAAVQETDPDVSFTLVATPNVIVSHTELAVAAEVFGDYQPTETYVWDPLYSTYAAEQLSGTDPDNGDSVVFSLIPSKNSPDMIGTVSELREQLAILQDDNPDLKVPSPLEAVTYWHTLRAQGESLTDNNTFNRTCIRHFDLPKHRVKGWLGVPDSYINNAGSPNLTGTSALHDHYPARIALG
jgi:hypothetical protein